MASQANKRSRDSDEDLLPRVRRAVPLPVSDSSSSSDDNAPIQLLPGVRPPVYKEDKYPHVVSIRNGVSREQTGAIEGLRDAYDYTVHASCERCAALVAALDARVSPEVARCVSRLIAAAPPSDLENCAQQMRLRPTRADEADGGDDSEEIESESDGDVAEYARDDDEEEEADAAAEEVVPARPPRRKRKNGKTFVERLLSVFGGNMWGLCGVYTIVQVKGEPTVARQDVLGVPDKELQEILYKISGYGPGSGKLDVRRLLFVGPGVVVLCDDVGDGMQVFAGHTRDSPKYRRLRCIEQVPFLVCTGRVQERRVVDGGETPVAVRVHRSGARASKRTSVQRHPRVVHLVFPRYGLSRAVAPDEALSAEEQAAVDDVGDMDVRGNRVSDPTTFQHFCFRWLEAVVHNFTTDAPEDVWNPTEEQELAKLRSCKARIVELLQAVTTTTVWHHVVARLGLSIDDGRNVDVARLNSMVDCNLTYQLDFGRYDGEKTVAATFVDLVRSMWVALKLGEDPDLKLFGITWEATERMVKLYLGCPSVLRAQIQAELRRAPGGDHYSCLPLLIQEILREHAQRRPRATPRVASSVATVLFDGKESLAEPVRVPIQDEHLMWHCMDPEDKLEVEAAPVEVSSPVHNAEEIADDEESTSDDARSSQLGCANDDGGVTAEILGDAYVARGGGSDDEDVVDDGREDRRGDSRRSLAELKAFLCDPGNMTGGKELDYFVRLSKVFGTTTQAAKWQVRLAGLKVPSKHSARLKLQFVTDLSNALDVRMEAKTAREARKLKMRPTLDELQREEAERDQRRALRYDEQVDQDGVVETIDTAGGGISVDYRRRAQHDLAAGEEQAWQQRVLDPSRLLEHEVAHVPDHDGVERKESAYTPVEPYVLRLLSRWKTDQPRMASLNGDLMFTGMVRIIDDQYARYNGDGERAAPRLHPSLFRPLLEAGLVENDAGPVIDPMDFENFSFEDVVDPGPVRDFSGPGPAPRSPGRISRPPSLSPPPDPGEPLEWAMVYFDGPP